MMSTYDATHSYWNMTEKKSKDINAGTVH